MGPIMVHFFGLEGFPVQGEINVGIRRICWEQTLLNKISSAKKVLPSVLILLIGMFATKHLRRLDKTANRLTFVLFNNKLSRLRGGDYEFSRRARRHFEPLAGANGTHLWVHGQRHLMRKRSPNSGAPVQGRRFKKDKTFVSLRVICNIYLR